MGLLLSVLAPYIFSGCLPFFKYFPSKILAPLCIAFPFCLFAYFCSQLPAIFDGEIVKFSIPWISDLGVNLSFQLDGLSLLFLFLITGIGSLVVLYSTKYLEGDARLTEFLAYIFVFMGSMIGLVCSQNLILLFIFWELTSISSFLLIGFHHEKPGSRTASLQALLVTGCGGIALLGGFLILGHIGGSYEINVLIEQKELILQSPDSGLALILILAGALTKSAQVPFHFWLPNAMAAPTPVSAYLHSATMVKAGIYLLARLSIIFSSTLIWIDVLVSLGILTAVIGSAMALTQTDLKKLLAYSTISSLGMLTVLLGLGTQEAIAAAMVYLFVHSLYKGSLFMIAGAIDHQTGSRDVLDLSGLFKLMPVTAGAASLSALSMAGFPPLFGFIGKELLYQAKFDSPEAGWIIYILSISANIMTVAIAFIVGIGPFSGRNLISPRTPKEADFRLLFGPVLLAVLGVFFGLLPGNFAAPLLSVAASVVSGSPQTVDLRYWHGFNLIFVFSLVTMAGGLFVYFYRDRVRDLIRKWPEISHLGPEKIYFKALDYLNLFSAAQTRFLQSGKLGRYILICVVSVCFLLSLILLQEGITELVLSVSSIGWGTLVLAVLIGFSALTVALSSSHILGAACIGFVGFGIAVFYAIYSAPDLAMTQILVESLSVILIVFLISQFPSESRERKSISQLSRAAASIFFGVIMAVLSAIGIQEAGQRDSISEYFAQNSLVQAHGRNIVNVILVDFRALDTLGEVTVLAIASLGVYSLLKIQKKSQKGEA